MLTGRVVMNATVKRLRSVTTAVALPRRFPTTFLPLEDIRSFGTKRRMPKAPKKRDDFSRTLMKYKQKQQKITMRPLAKALKPNKQAFKDIAFKWMLEAFPESLSRQEIAARMGLRPVTVKSQIIKPLLAEGKIFKWGQKSMPYERYMPNIKAPEYYEVTGESPPTVPAVDENEFLTAAKKRSQTQKKVKRHVEEDEQVEKEELQLADPELEHISDDSSLSENENKDSWDDLYEASEEEDVDDENDDRIEDMTGVLDDHEDDEDESAEDMFDFEDFSESEDGEEEGAYQNGEILGKKGKSTKQKSR